ncbi:hypothetical protein AVEN_110369-1 [Araneus ventricosus]|uniref:Attacin C-terminal domain-containing protein n=1 Tax=Araneus ventricosus TaxID=182803 RepID=A0A4Y2EKY6_ARAVE|nr:hypothetical protein AVEN_110369-1 [Araneus ventricosus]
MKGFCVSSLLIVSLVFVSVFCEEKKPEPKVGEPQYSLEAAGGGNNARNFNAGFNAGVGTRVWESKNKDMSLDLGVSYGRGYQRVDGHTFKSPPQYGLGGTFRWGRK